MNKGLFITFEGIDGCGKTTIAKMVYEKLLQLGYPVVFTREPGGSEIAEQIREVLLNPNNTLMDARSESLLYAAARRQHLIETVLPALDDKKIVLCDRYIDSSLAYQGNARKIGIDEVFQMNKFATDNLMPESTLLFKLTIEEASKRMNQRQDFDRLDREDALFHEAVAEGYDLVEKLFKKRIKCIDASKGIDEVFEQALNVIMELIALYE